MVNCSSATNRGLRGFQPLELVAMILGFVFFWPIGLAILVFKLCGGHFPRFAGPQGENWSSWNSGSWGSGSWGCGPWGGSNSSRYGWQGSRSGNEAFEEY